MAKIAFVVRHFQTLMTGSYRACLAVFETCPASALITVWEAILTGKQTREKLQCLYEDQMRITFEKFLLKYI